LGSGLSHGHLLDGQTVPFHVLDGAAHLPGGGQSYDNRRMEPAADTAAAHEGLILVAHATTASRAALARLLSAAMRLSSGFPLRQALTAAAHDPGVASHQ